MSKTKMSMGKKLIDLLNQEIAGRAGTNSSNMYRVCPNIIVLRNKSGCLKKKDNTIGRRMLSMYSCVSNEPEITVKKMWLSKMARHAIVKPRSVDFLRNSLKRLRLPSGYSWKQDS